MPSYVIQLVFKGIVESRDITPTVCPSKDRLEEVVEVIADFCSVINDRAVYIYLLDKFSSIYWLTPKLYGVMLPKSTESIRKIVQPAWLRKTVAIVHFLSGTHCSPPCSFSCVYLSVTFNMYNATTNLITIPTKP